MGEMQHNSAGTSYEVDDGWFQLQKKHSSQPRILESQHNSQHISPAIISEAHIDPEDEDEQEALYQQSHFKDRPSFDVENDSPQQATKPKHRAIGQRALLNNRTLELRDGVGLEPGIPVSSITTPNDGVLFSHQNKRSKLYSHRNS